MDVKYSLHAVIKYLYNTFIPPLHCHVDVLMLSLSPCSNEFSQLVASEYLSFFDFSGLTLDRALR